MMMLKKLFLKSLYEHRRLDGRFQSHGWATRSVIDKIPYLYPELAPLTEQEKHLFLRAVYELERDGYVWTDPTQGGEHMILSPLGNKVAAEELEKMKLP